MHGCGLGSALLVNAEVDSMGGVVDGGVGIGIKTSPRRAAIERAQVELRQEYDVREERRRELEFLEKGGNPLDFKFGNAASVSVQSTSLTDHQIEHIVTSEAKGSFALTASPHGDSVESSGRPGAPTVCEPNSADNFDAENEILESGRNPKHPRRSNVAPSEQSSQMDGTQNAKESEDSAVVRPYARRNRSRPNRDGARSSSTDVVQNSGGHGSLLQVRGGSRDAKGSISDTNQEKEWNTPSGSNPKSTASNGDMVSQVENANAQPPMELDGAQASEVVAGSFKSSIQDNRMDVTEASIAGDSQQEKKNFSEVNDQKMPVDVASGECDQAGVDEQLTLAGSVSPTVSAVAKPENENGSVPLNGFSELKKDGNEVHNGNGAMGLKGLDSESSCTQSSLVDANNENGVFVNGRNDDTNGIIVKQTSAPEEMQNSLACETGNEKNEVKAIDCGDVLKEDETLLQLNQPGNDSAVKIEEEIKMSTDDAKCTSNFKGVENSDHDASMVDKKLSADLVDDSNLSKEIICPDVPQSSVDISNKELPESTSAEKNCSAAPDPQPSSDSHLIAAEKAREDSLLEEARSIEAKLKRIAELTVGIVPMESRRKSHWDFVLEEMTWLANDFAQERLWKITAAAQICHRAAFSSRLRVEEQNQLGKPKKVAYTLAKAVMEFWHLAESLITNDDQFVDLQKDKNELKSFDGNKLSKDKSVELDKDSCKELESQIRGKNLVRLIQGYAVNFLKFNKSSVPSLQAEAPATPDRLVDLGIAGTSWEDHLTEESLFYAVPPGAMEAYRISIESHLSQCEKTGSNIQEEVDTSMYDATADFGYRETAYDEEDGETNAYYLHGGFEGIKLTKHDQKKKKNLKYPADFPYGTYSVVSQPNTLLKRPANNLHVGAIPTKRVRTTPRPRFIGPYTSGATGSLQTPTKTDPSSGDTSSFQDEQSTLHGGSQVLKGMEVESAVEQLTYDCAETSTKPKKKKKAKHLLQASAYEGWQLDSPVHNEQKDNFKKRLDSPHFDSNGTSGLYGQHIAKKPKIMKQSLDSNYDNMAQSGSIPSPVASQMSNMPSANKVVKLIVGRDRGRKPKTHKVPSGPQGPGSAWSLFEDQALVVLVHDMGPNWELVSDAINSALQFKCIFRKPKECKERHKILMDKSGGDDYDSADDSRNSQSYPSTLPGIPKGSARQLFQRLQGPMEEDTIKSHFEKIIVIGKKYHYRRNQNDNQDLKQIVPVHSSHIAALDQVPTNQNGGVLTPLDIWDAAPATPDGIPMTYQSSHAGGLPFTNQGAAGSTLPSGVNSSLQVSPGAVLGNTSSSSAPPNGPVRDGRYGVPRASLSVDEQQRMQHYNQMMNRNLQPQNLSVSGADRGVRLLPGGNPAGMMPGMGRSMPLPRPGFQGMASSSMLNSGSMLSSGMAGMPSPVGMQSASGSGQGNSMMRSRDGPHMMRAAQNSEHQRQMMAPELQMQVTQAHSPAIPAFNGLNSTPPAMPAYPGHSQQQHQMPLQQTHPMTNSHLQGSNHLTGSQQQAYAMRISKQRQMQQQQHQHQHHPFAASGALMSHAQPSSQLPVSSTVQSSAQIQPQTSSQPLTPSSPMTPMLGQPQQQKHALLHHGVSRNSQTVAGGLTNQMGKQRPRQPQQNQQFQQSGRIHPPQRQHSQSPQPAKHLKGMGRGNVVLPQNLSVDHSPLNGLSVPPGNQSADKGEHMMHLIQGQGLYSGSALSSMPQSKPLVTQSLNHSQSQQKPFSAAALPSSKQVQQTQSHTDNNPQGQVPSVPSSHPLSAGHQVHPAAILASNHQHLHPQPQAHQKQAGHAQPTVQRMLQQNRQMNADPQTKSQTDQGHTAQQPLCNVSQMGTSTTTSMSPASNDSASVVPAVASQWKPSDSSCPALVNSASPAGSVAGLAVTNSVRSEAVSSVNQGLGQRQLSGGLMQQNSAGVQRPPHPLPPQSAPPPPQQLFQPQEQQEQQQSRQQLPSQPHSQQHNPHLQPAQGSLYIRPANSQME